MFCWFMIVILWKMHLWNPSYSKHSLSFMRIHNNLLILKEQDTNADSYSTNVKVQL